MYCKKCGGYIPDGFEVCPKCGAIYQLSDGNGTGNDRDSGEKSSEEQYGNESSFSNIPGADIRGDGSRSIMNGEPHIDNRTAGHEFNGMVPKDSDHGALQSFNKNTPHGLNGNVQQNFNGSSSQNFNSNAPQGMPQQGFNGSGTGDLYGEDHGHYGQADTAHGKAVASLVLGIIGVVFWLTGNFAFISAILGIIGIILSSAAKKSGNSESIRTAGFVLSLIALIGGCIVCVACMACLGTVAGISEL